MNLFRKSTTSRMSGHGADVTDPSEPGHLAHQEDELLAIRCQLGERPAFDELVDAGTGQCGSMSGGWPVATMQRGTSHRMCG